MSLWRSDAESLNTSLYHLMRRAEREVNRIHNRYRAEMRRIMTHYLNRGNLNQPLTVEEIMDFLVTLPTIRDELRAAASPMASQIIDRVFGAFLQTRLDALIFEIKTLMIRMNIDLENLIATNIEESFSRAYYHTSFNIARRSRIGTPIPRLRDDTLIETLSEDWSGTVWQSRQWNNNQTILGYMLVILGTLGNRDVNNRTIINSLTERFEFSRWQTIRILRTESSHYSNVGINQAYDLNEIEWYVYIATLDCHTCGDCGELDSRVFRLRDMRIGANAPLLHPHCRCTKAPTFPDEEDSRWRRARRENGRNQVIDGRITYHEWFDRFVQ